MATPHGMRRLQIRLGYTFHHAALLQQALTHRSAGVSHNKKLALLGDTLLNFVITNELYRRFPDASEGDLTQMRAVLVCGKTLTELAPLLFSASDVVLGKGIVKVPAFQSDAVEAIIGAIYLDSQRIEVIEKLIIGWYRRRLAVMQPGDKQKDPKSRLQEYVQAIYKIRPVYTILAIEGGDHEPKFVVECQIAAVEHLAFIGEGSNKRRAEQAAARRAMASLKIDTAG